MRFLLVILLCFVCADAFAAFGGNDIDIVAEERWDDFGSDLDTQTWWGVTGGVSYNGVAVCSAQAGTSVYELQDSVNLDNGIYCWCKVNYPFDGQYMYVLNFPDAELCKTFYGYDYSSCVEYCVSEKIRNCYSGAYMSSESIMNIHNILMSSKKNIKMCDLLFKTSTGLSYKLYKEKTTSPALGVQNGEQVCWGRLEPGQASPGLNIKYDGAVYHLVD